MTFNFYLPLVNPPSFEKTEEVIAPNVNNDEGLTRERSLSDIEREQLAAALEAESLAGCPCCSGSGKVRTVGKWKHYIERIDKEGEMMKLFC